MLGGTNFTYELGATDVNHTFSNFTGLWSKHTSSNNDNIFFDDISINGNIVVDSLSPFIQSSNIKSSNSIELQFSRYYLIVVVVHEMIISLHILINSKFTFGIFRKISLISI